MLVNALLVRKEAMQYTNSRFKLGRQKTVELILNFFNHTIEIANNPQAVSFSLSQR